MINEALTFLEGELNTYLKASFKINEDAVVVSSIAEFGGSAPLKNQNKIVLTLINIKQETLLRNNPSFKVIDKTSVQVNPALYINLFVLFSANFADYQESLKFISATISFFQGNYVFTKEKFNKLNPAIDPLILELDTTSYQDWSYLWGMLGGKYLPSVIYKLRMITVQENVTGEETPLIQTIDTVVKRDN